MKIHNKLLIKNLFNKDRFTESVNIGFKKRQNEIMNIAFKELSRYDDSKLLEDVLKQLLTKLEENDFAHNACEDILSFRMNIIPEISGISELNLFNKSLLEHALYIKFIKIIDDGLLQHLNEAGFDIRRFVHRYDIFNYNEYKDHISLQFVLELTKGSIYDSLMLRDWAMFLAMDKKYKEDTITEEE